MSRIGGVVRRNGRDSNETVARSLLSIFKDRGPDSQGVWADTDVAMCHASLRTTPEANLERQPISNKRGTAICTADIRIDNRDKLIRRLRLTKGEKYQLSDSELLLQAYEEWGLDVPKHLIGDFSFAIWDRTKHRLFCSRDAMGVRPLYYCNYEAFLFSSEVSSLLQVSEYKQGGINEDQVISYLRGGVSSKKSTFYTHICRVPPGHSIVVKPSGRVHEWRYWVPESDLKPLKLKDDEEYEEAFREVFEKSVNSCLRSSSKVGFMLSGGLDSSAVFRAALESKNGTSASGSIIYSGVYPSYSDENVIIDESDYIEDVIKPYDILRRNIISDEISPLNGVRQILRIKGEPFQARGHYMMWKIGKRSNNDGVKVILDGMGGDIVVGYGYEYFESLAREKNWSEFASLANQLESNCHTENISLSSEDIFFRYGLSYIINLVRTGSLEEAAKSIYRVTGCIDMSRSRLLRKILWRTIPFQIRQKLSFSRLQTRDIVRGAADKSSDGNVSGIPDSWMRSRISALRDATLFEPMESVDPLMAHHHVELRHPFCDRRLIEFCLSVPPRQLIKGGWPRSLLRRAMDRYLPESVANRLQKAQLGAAIARNLVKFESDEIEHVLHDSSIDPYVDSRALQQTYKRLLQGTSLGSDAERLIRCIILSLWLQNQIG